MSLEKCGVPVAFFIFNRPALAQRVFDRIAQARPPKLLVIADGPRAAYPDDAGLCRQSRQVVARADWGCEVLTNFSDQNLGCRRRLSSGLDWVFSQVPEAIVLEDDCLPDPTFFPFCEELLARYRNDPRVHMVRGANFLKGLRYSSQSYYFSRFFHIWGWASWARAWRHYDVDMSQWPERRGGGWLKARLPPHMVDLVTRIFDDTRSGALPTWEFQWQFASWLRDAVAIAPWNNLVTNIGFDDSGTHMKNAAHPYARLPTTPIRFPLRHARRPEVNGVADLQEWDYAFPQAARHRTFWRRAAVRAARTRSLLYQALGW